LPDQRSLGRAGPTQRVRGVILVEKMHLWTLAFEGENFYSCTAIEKK
jgi:hypothetical protein